MLTHQTVAAGSARATELIHVEGRVVDAPDTVDVLPTVLQALVEADLSAGGYRVVLDTLARFLLRGVASEAVPVEWMAERLNLSRNTVGAAYQAAEAAGLLRRIAVAERGAPTRTALQGPLLRLLTTTKAPANAACSATRRFTATGRGSSRRPTPRSIVNSPVAVYERISPAPCHEEPAASPEANPAQMGQSIDAPNQTASDDAPSPSATEPTPPKLTPAEMMAALDTVPSDARLMATFARGPKEFVIDPAWNLTDTQIAALRMLLPKPESRPPPNAVPRTQTGGRLAPPEVVIAIRNWMPRLERLVGKGRAPIVGDEIAYQVMEKLLGNGNRVGGVRAGLSMVAKGQWRTPRGFTAEWLGVVDRGYMQIATEDGTISKSPSYDVDVAMRVAQKTVH